MNVNNVVLKESELIRRYVDERQIPGACFSIVTPKEIAYSSYGNKALVPEEEATSTDTLYDIASLSKVVSTSTMIAKLIEEGRLSFDTKVSSVLTDFPHEDITVKDLLVHTSGYRRMTRTTRSVRDQRNSMISSFACPGLTRGAKRLSIPVLITCF